MEAQTVSPYGALSKLAGDDLDPGFVAQNQAARSEAARIVAQMLLASVGAGAVARGGVGAWNMMRPRKLPYRAGPLAQQIQMRMPRKDEEDEEPKRAAEKQANEYGALTNFLRESLFKLTPSQLADPSIMDTFRGALATKPWAIPATAAVGFPAAAIGGIGTYALMDKLLDTRREAEKTDELDSAKEQYERLLDESYAKAASDEEILDGLAQVAMEKQAGIEELYHGVRQGLGNMGGAAAGGLGAYAILTALLSGKISYDWFRQRNERSITEEAMRRRAKQRAGGLQPAHVTLDSTPRVT